MPLFYAAGCLWYKHHRMIVSITCLRLRSPLKIPTLIRLSRSIFKQLDSTDCMNVKTRGFWKNHYTITHWQSYEDMRAFMGSGAHREAMKMSKVIAEEIRVLSMECDSPPSWEEAKWLLKNDGQIYAYRLHE